MHLQILAHLDILMGGRVAEEVIFGKSHVTTGASSDLQQATNMARSMITQWGMSSTLGPMYYPQSELDMLSPATREAVDVRWDGASVHVVEDPQGVGAAHELAVMQRMPESAARAVA